MAAARWQRVRATYLQKPASTFAAGFSVDFAFEKPAAKVPDGGHVTVGGCTCCVSWLPSTQTGWEAGTAGTLRIGHK